MSQQQTVLRVQTNIPGLISGSTQYDFLDLYGDIPIKINKSFAELQDIAKRNSDFSIGLSLPGSKKNNRFFENFFNVDAQSLYFDATKRVPCNVLLNDQSYFTGYMRLNKTSVMNSKVEYDVTLYSSIGDLFGNIGNGLLKDLNYADSEYHFNHTFNQGNVTNKFGASIFLIDDEKPYTYFYPIVHNGYEYSGDTVNLSGSSFSNQTRLYTTSSPISGFTSQANAWAAGVKQYRINSPGQGIIDNQLKPALNVWSLFQLIFKTYGYEITSDFFNTPWFKGLYTYGYFSSDSTKFSYNVGTIPILPLEGCEIIYTDNFYRRYEVYHGCDNDRFIIENLLTAYVVKAGTGIPVYCAQDITLNFNFLKTGYGIPDTNVTKTFIIPARTSGITQTYIYRDVPDCIYYTYTNLGLNSSSSVGLSTEPLLYLPVPSNTNVPFTDGVAVDFSLVIDQNIKQIDFIASVAKKFNLIFVPDSENSNKIIIEPYNYYIGTGEVKDWSGKISFDKGFTVEPALNYVESELDLSDLEDGDYGNKEFKDRNNKIYGQNRVYNPTDFKSQVKKIDTIFSAEIIRTWDDNIAIPLGINYAGSTSSETNGGSESINYYYKGVKTKPKLMYWLGGFNPFLNIIGEHYNSTNYPTYALWVGNSTGGTVNKFFNAPIISHTMPIGNPDNNKINNDTICNLFNSEQPLQIGTLSTYNVYTENDAYGIFYQNRVDNLYNANTRFLKGKFDIKYSDIQNLRVNDLIKINEQYFTWNKINGFNLTNRELTDVELIQTNNNPSVYPKRYFKYFYCDRPGYVFKFSTDFTNPNLLDTNYFWSILYDYNIGLLGGSGISGFTSSFVDFQPSAASYVGFTMYEVDETDYLTGYSWECDCLHNYIYSQDTSTFGTYIPTFWLNSGQTITGLNVFTGCTEFNSFASTYNITTGTSTYHGDICCAITTPTPTPTPTMTPTATPTPTPTPTPLTNNSQYMFFAGDNNFYISDDYGNNWVNHIVSTPGTGYTANAFVMGYDGKTILRSIQGASSPIDYNVYLSKDGGITWNTITEVTSIYQPTTMSSNLKTIAGYALENVPYTGGGIFYSTLFTKISNDYGVSFTRNDIITENSNNFGFQSGTAVSQNGQYIMFGYAAGGIETGVTTGHTYLSIDSGVTFNTIPSLDNPIVGKPGYNISLNGQVQTAANSELFNNIGKRNAISKDFGVTWSGFTIGGDDNIYMFAWDTSQDGKYIFTSTGTYTGFDDIQYWISSNTGNTFTEITGQLPIKNISTISVSNDGQYVLAGYGTNIAENYISKDYGLTFTNLNLTSAVNSVGLNKFYGSPSPAPTATPTPTPTIAPTATPTPTPTPTFAPVTYEYNYTFNSLGTTRTKVVTGLDLTYPNGGFNLPNISTTLSSANRSGNEVDNSGDSIGDAGVSRSISRLSTGSGTVTINSSVITLYVNGSVVDTYNVTTPFTLTTTSKTNSHTFYSIPLNYGDTVTVSWVEHS
jgi:hypothetical protein